MTKPKLTYFDFSGSRGEECRLAFVVAGVDFEDHRLRSGTWPDVKPSTPFGSLPILEIEGKGQLAECNAILTYIGREHGLHPKDPWEAARHEALMSATESLRFHLGATVSLAEDEKKAAREALLQGALPRFGKSVEAQLGDGPFVAGAQINVADLKRDDDGLKLHIRHAMQGHSSTARRGPTKTRRWRTLPVPEVLEDWLDAHCERSNLGAPLFSNPNTGERWSHGAARDTWIKATEAIGVEVGFYEGTKHSRATGWLADGVDERIIQKALGQSDIAMTHKYALLGDGALVQLIKPKKKVTH